jgi:serine/threonine protein kinase
MSGAKVDHYEVKELVGSGGMGEVYRAFDLVLNRDVAIKFLLTHSDQKQYEHLLNEARAIAAVDHPGICTIHGFGEFNNRPFLVLELLQGRSMDQELRRNKLEIDDFLDLAIQTCEGLAAAHKRGIVHGDLKPSNIFVTENPRRTKILDFGVAYKTIPTLQPTTHPALSPQVDSVQGGPVGGTIPYMSPEQSLGLAIDARSDIFSLGIVFYEMLTGVRPFNGSTASAIINSIRTANCPSPKQVRPETTPEVERIILRTLLKDPALRYQNVELLRGDLLVCRRAQSAPLDARRHKRISTVGLACAGLLAILLFVFAFLKAMFPEPESLPKVSKVWSTDTTTQETTPSIAPDGSYVVFASDRIEGKWKLFKQDVGTRNPVLITTAKDAEEFEPALSPNGRLLAFTSRGEINGEGIFIRDLKDNAIRRVAPFGHQPCWSPDSTSLAFVDEAMDDPQRTVTQRSALWLSTTTGNFRKLYAGDARQPKWSPLGSRIVFVSVKSGRRTLQTISVGGGSPEPVENTVAVDWSPEWSEDGRYLYFCSDRDHSMNLWRIKIDQVSGKTKGSAMPVTVPDDYISHISIARKTNRLAYTRDLSRTSLFRIRLEGRRKIGSPQPLSISSQGLLFAGINPAATGSMVAFHSHRGVEHVFAADLSKGDMSQLTNTNWNDRVPRWSPDGKSIAFQSQRSGTWEIWLMDADGSHVRQLTHQRTAPGAVNPVWSSDGQRLAYSEQGGPVRIVDLSQPASAQSQAAIVTLPAAGNGAFFLAKHWSPCGDSLTGSLHRSDGETIGIAVQNVTTGTISQITADGGEAPNWADQCAAIVYRLHGSLSIVDVQSHESHVLFSSPTFNVYDSIGVNKTADWLYFTNLASEKHVAVAAIDHL